MVKERAKEEILQRIDILDLISEYVTIKKSGRNYIGLCPFHPEKTPSFHVNKEKQFFYCFGCNAGGNAITFLMKKEGITFPEAMERLGRRCGIEFRENENKTGETSEKQRIVQINNQASEFFIANLKGSREGIDYLRFREMQEGTQEGFGLGYALPSWDSLYSHFSRSVPVQLLLKSGLICERQRGNGYYDRFRDRIIFPIHNLYGDICGFGGRLINNTEEGPKYLNSPETPAYSKGNILYGLYRTKTAIGQKREAIVVEGYLDLLTVFQTGFENVVATLGTALTPGQVRLLKRHTNDVVLLFDSDLAGRKAAQRGIDLFLDQGIRVKVAVMSTAKDPDSLIRQEGKEAFAKVLDEAKPFIDFLLQSVGFGSDRLTIQQRAQKTDQIIPILAHMKDPLERDGYIHYLSQKSGISDEAIRERIGGLIRPQRGSMAGHLTRPEDLLTSVQGGDAAERLLIGLALDMSIPSEILIQGVSDAVFRNPECRELAAMILEKWRQGISVAPQALLTEAQSESQKKLIYECMIKGESFDNPDSALQDCIDTLRRRRVDEKLRGIRLQLDSESLAEQEAEQLLIEYCRLKKEGYPLDNQ